MANPVRFKHFSYPEPPTPTTARAHSPRCALALAFASADPFNSAVLDGATGARLFDVESASAIWHGGALVLTTVSDAAGHVVGAYEGGSAALGLCGDEQMVGGRLSCEGWWSRSVECLPWRIEGPRVLSAPNGRIYVWKQRWNGSLELLDAATQQPVAETHRAGRGGIDVGSALVPYVDAVTLSFLICERMRREEEAVSMLETRWTRGW